MKLTKFSLPILWCSQSRDQAIYQIWKLPKKNFIYLVSQWNLSLKNGIFGIFQLLKSGEFGINFPWISFILGSSLQFFFIRKLVNCFPKMEKLVEFTQEKHISSKFSLLFFQKWPKHFGKKEITTFEREEIIFFRLKLGENSPVKQSLQLNWFAFSQTVFPILTNFSAHILNQIVLLCIGNSVAQFHIVFWFLV